MSWSLRPGMIDTLSIRVGLELKMFTPCGRGNCLLKEAVFEDFQTLSVKWGKFTVRGGC